jgi:lysozyme family protein
MTFKEALEFTLRWEGGKVDDKLDRGGRTAYGIIQRVYDEWRLGKGLEIDDVWLIDMDDVEAIYAEKYWHVAKCNQLPDKLDLCMFDAAVNHGPRKATQFLQRACCVVDDGDFGPKTLIAVEQDKSAGRLEFLIAGYLKAREQFYADIVQNNPTQIRFLKGWLSRLNDLRNTVGVEA